MNNKNFQIGGILLFILGCALVVCSRMTDGQTLSIILCAAGWTLVAVGMGLWLTHEVLLERKQKKENQELLERLASHLPFSIHLGFNKRDEALALIKPHRKHFLIEIFPPEADAAFMQRYVTGTINREEAEYADEKIPYVSICANQLLPIHNKTIYVYRETYNAMKNVSLYAQFLKNNTFYPYE